MAFQDSEGFDSGLLSDIITLLRYGFPDKSFLICLTRIDMSAVHGGRRFLLPCSLALPRLSIYWKVVCSKQRAG